MKKIIKKLSCMFIAAAMLISLTATTASASVSYDKSIVAYYVKNGSNSESIYISGLTSKSTISKSTVKTSNENVVSLYSLNKNISKGEYTYFVSGFTDHNYSSYNYNIDVELKGTGSAKVSYKIGSKTYTTNFKVYAYTNPLKTLTITGVNGGKNVASAFNSTNSVSGNKLSKTQKSAKITVAAKSGWKITSVYYSNSSLSYSVYSYSSGLSKAILRPDKLTAGSSQSVRITLKNTKTGGTVNCYYHFS